MERIVKTIDPTVSRSVSNAIERMNEVVIDTMLACAKSGDPLAPKLLGVSKEVLDEIRMVSKADFMSVSRTGSFSLVKLRFESAAVWRHLRASGFSKSTVLSELLKEPGFVEDL
jgi:hypothetical protein